MSWLWEVGAGCEWGQWPVQAEGCPGHEGHRLGQRYSLPWSSAWHGAAGCWGQVGQVPAVGLLLGIKQIHDAGCRVG